MEKIYAIYENKCHKEITNSINEIVSLSDLGFSKNTPLNDIINAVNGVLIYNVIPENTLIYPVKESSVVTIIRTDGDVAVVNFVSSNNAFVKYCPKDSSNHYFTDNKWQNLSKRKQLTMTCSKLASKSEVTISKSLSDYGVTNNTDFGVIVTAMGSMGSNISYGHCLGSTGTLYIWVKNNTSNQFTDIEFNVCII